LTSHGKKGKGSPAGPWEKGNIDRAPGKGTNQGKAGGKQGGALGHVRVGEEGGGVSKGYLNPQKPQSETLLCLGPWKERPVEGKSISFSQGGKKDHFIASDHRTKQKKGGEVTPMTPNGGRLADVFELNKENGGGKRHRIPGGGATDKLAKSFKRTHRQDTFESSQEKRNRSPRLKHPTPYALGGDARGGTQLGAMGRRQRKEKKTAAGI